MVTTKFKMSRSLTAFLGSTVALVASAALTSASTPSSPNDNCHDQAYDCAVLYISETPKNNKGTDESSQNLDLAGYKLTFEDNFDKLDIAADGTPGNWYAPKHAPIGAQFVPPGPNGPFFVQDKHLIIRARKLGDTWHSGLLQTLDSKWHGFAQQYGYFEVRAKFSSNPASFPAFWLVNRDLQTIPGSPLSEIDIFEGNGGQPGMAYLHAHMTPCYLCTVRGRHWVVAKTVAMADTVESYHTYGVMIDDTWITYYIDRKEVMRIPTLDEYKTPFYILLDLGAHESRALSEQSDTMDMNVDYVRVYQKM